MCSRPLFIYATKIEHCIKLNLDVNKERERERERERVKKKHKCNGVVDDKEQPIVVQA